MAKQEYVIKNRQWLADKSHEEGVMAVGAGVFAKVLKKGLRREPLRIGTR